MEAMSSHPRQPLFPRRAVPCIEAVEWDVVKILQRMSGEERIRLGCALGDGLRRMVAQQIRTNHPDWNSEQILHEMLRRAPLE